MDKKQLKADYDAMPVAFRGIVDFEKYCELRAANEAAIMQGRALHAEPINEDENNDEDDDDWDDDDFEEERIHRDMLVDNVTIGADPELFLIDTTTGQVVSSIGIIPGEKGKPYRSADMPEGYGLEIDNILAEFNIPPARTKEDFTDSITYMKNYIRKFIKKKNPNLDILCKASMDVPEDQLQSPEAKMFGCSVDYNAYTMGPNPKPKGEVTNLRSAGFHIHIGYNNFNVETSIALIKYLDMYLGVPSVLKDPDTKRRSLYGKAGCFRLTPYGLEYRVLSSAFLANKTLLNWVFKGVWKAIEAYNEGYPFAPEDKVIKAINESNVELATKLCEEYRLN